MNAIRLENVTKIYRRSHLGRVQETIAVSDLNLTVPAGEAFGLLGLNGCGKTTTIKMLLGHLRPTKGRVEILGKPMPDLDVLQRIGYIPDAAYLNKNLTGAEALWLYATLSKIPRTTRHRAVDEILDKVGMTAAASKRISEYSKGMLQRISMAQALIHQPELLIMDEPITGLDPLAVKEVRQLVAWLKSQGRTVFLSSHDISEVEKICDRIGILSSGRLAVIVDHKEWGGKEGRLEEIFTSTVSRGAGIGALKLS